MSFLRYTLLTDNSWYQPFAYMCNLDNREKVSIVVKTTMFETSSCFVFLGIFMLRNSFLKCYQGNAIVYEQVKHEIFFFFYYMTFSSWALKIFFMSVIFYVKSGVVCNVTKDTLKWLYNSGDIEFTIAIV